MVNQLGKFSPNIAQLSKPLRDLLSQKKSWIWSSFQDEAFEKIKMELTKPTVLAPYDVNVKTKISLDASDYGLGPVINTPETTRLRLETSGLCISSNE